MTFDNFDALFNHAKDASLKVAVLTGAFNNLTGTVAGVTAQMVVLTADGPTDIYVDRTKIFGAFIPAQESAQQPEPTSDPQPSDDSATTVQEQ